MFSGKDLQNERDKKTTRELTMLPLHAFSCHITGAFKFLNFQCAENCIYMTVHIWEAGSWNIKFAEHFLIKEEDVGE